MVRKLTDAMVSIEGENMRPVTWCIVEEVKSGDWGIARESLDDRRCESPRSRRSKRLASLIISSDQCALAGGCALKRFA